MKERIILHSDLNNFYASVECLHRPEIQDKPVAVCGDPLLRQGIILAKNYPAKATGVKTGEALWQARQKCPRLIVVPPNFDLYLRFARLAREIYAGYTDQVESFGLDEAWLDVTGSSRVFGDGQEIADQIRSRIKEELGVTASVGVSYNKIFAKLGSDMKKPDATTIISSADFRQKVWPLPAGDLLYVGRSTKRKLASRGVISIGDLALADPNWLRTLLGKWGEVLWTFANGLDNSPVTRWDETIQVKSVGNSVTTPRDLETDGDVTMVFYVLSESVAERMRGHGCKCRTVQIYIRDKNLNNFNVQGKISRPTQLSADVAEKALELFRRHYDWANPIRSLGVKATDLVAADSCEQLFLFNDESKRLKQEMLESTVDKLRNRFGHCAIQRALLLQDQKLGEINPKEDHAIHPVAFFKEGGLP